MQILIITNELFDAEYSRLPFCNYLNEKGYHTADVAVLSNFAFSHAKIIHFHTSTKGIYQLINFIKSKNFSHIIIRSLRLVLHIGLLLPPGKKYLFYITGLGRLWGIHPTTASSFVRSFIKLYLRTITKRLGAKYWFQNSDDPNDINLTGAIINGSGLDTYRLTKPKSLNKQILFAGRLEYYKGIKTLLEFVNIAYKYQYTTIICGKIGKLRNSDLNLLLSLIGKGAIEYHGFSKDVPALLLRSSFAVYPSALREGIPRFILESLAYGCIPIIPDIPGCREILNLARCVELVETKTTVQKVSAIDQDIFTKYINHNSNLFNMRYSRHQVYKHMLQLLRSL